MGLEPYRVLTTLTGAHPRGWTPHWGQGRSRGTRRPTRASTRGTSGMLRGLTRVRLRTRFPLALVLAVCVPGTDQTVRTCASRLGSVAPSEFSLQDFCDLRQVLRRRAPQRRAAIYLRNSRIRHETKRKGSSLLHVHPTEFSQCNSSQIHAVPWF